MYLNSRNLLELRKCSGIVLEFPYVYLKHKANYRNDINIMLSALEYVKYKECAKWSYHSWNLVDKKIKDWGLLSLYTL